MAAWISKVNVPEFFACPRVDSARFSHWHARRVTKAVNSFWIPANGTNGQVRLVAADGSPSRGRRLGALEGRPVWHGSQSEPQYDASSVLSPPTGLTVEVIDWLPLQHPISSQEYQ